MRIKIEPMLYLDPQSRTLWFSCPCCGGAAYPPSLRCLRCERREGL